MNRVKVASTAGFCFGVERAVKLAVSALQNGPCPVYTLGPIIHNPQEVHRLENMGIRMAESIEDVPEGTIIIRSHGATRGVVEAAEARGLRVVDATCPFVNRLRDRVISLGEEGYQVVLVGQADHPEVRSVVSFAPDDSLVTQGVDDLEKAGRLKSRVGIVAQTTHPLENLQRVAAHCVGVCVEVKIFRTTCQATQTRTQEARAMAREVDVMFVVGGLNSANTTRLTEAAAQEGTTTYHIESADEIQGLDLPAGAVIGVTAGASTPLWIIEEVVQALENDVEKSNVQGPTSNGEA